MFKNLESKNNKNILKKLVTKQSAIDTFILDGENAIIIVENNDQTNHKENYIMIHQRLVNHELVEVNRCYISIYYTGGIHHSTLIKDLNLFQVQNGCGRFNALYDYKKGEFIVPKGIWGMIDAGSSNYYLKNYNGFIACFGVNANHQKEDTIKYVNAISKQESSITFDYSENYYAILNLDGTIRKNILFRGKMLDHPEEIIYLDHYESLEAFKQERKAFCNQQKELKKASYQKMIEERNNGSNSPYFDQEIAKILKLSYDQKDE